MTGFIGMTLAGLSLRDLLYYGGAAVLVLLVLFSIAQMSRVEKAVSANKLGSLVILLAIILTLWYYQIVGVWQIWIGLLIGSAIGLYLSIRVTLIQMPQLVGLLNGLGGGASLMAGILTFLPLGPGNYFVRLTAALAIFVGGLTLGGSLVAAGKLHRVLPQQPKRYKGHNAWTLGILILNVIALLGLTLEAALLPSRLILLCYLLLGTIASLAQGYFFAIRVGGADMPITISLLNSFSGLAGAIAGLALGDALLVAVGGIVGASGLLLTQIMCRSMNRHLLAILMGTGVKPLATKKPPQEPSAPNKTAAISDELVNSQSEERKVEPESTLPPSASLTPTTRAGQWLHQAKTVILVPGYGMALAQAQRAVQTLAQDLQDAGKQVRYAIHPVAGRMPGHMNVLLAEVDVPYDQLYEMEAINGDFKSTDVVLVVGANDVLNPAANTAEGTPIYGMPVLAVNEAPHVIICNYDTKPGYAGVPNPLYEQGEEQVALLLGDAKEKLQALQQAYQAEKRTEKKSTQDREPHPSESSNLSGADLAGRWLEEARSVIIVPGYGMALGQAQRSVQSLAQTLQDAGKQVRYAIHPVAGRMPGHMNVLLAEVDVSYDQLYEMEVINGDFKSTDVVLVVGANDVLNPAANTAEGTPIYGMPVLAVNEAPHVIICNFDTKPGYAGVPNPLYEQGADQVVLLLGDAKEKLQILQEAYRNAKSTLELTRKGHALETVVDQAEQSEDKPVERAAEWLRQAQSVIVVPGYGMALAQAQRLVQALAQQLERAGKEVRYAIHPVAGRMPGHMNVLLAEVDVSYDKLYEMEAINGDFKSTDVVLVVGANDVLNPAANTAEGTPIYGMPVLAVNEAAHVIICNFDTKPGYAGVPNPLYEAPANQVALLLGDAKEQLNELQEAYLH